MQHIYLSISLSFSLSFSLSIYKYGFFYKQQFYKQRQIEIGKKTSKC